MDANHASQDLKESVSVLVDNMTHSNQSDEQITSSIYEIVEKSKLFVGNIEQTNKTVEHISQKIKTTVNETKHISEDIREMSDSSYKSKEELIESAKDYLSMHLLKRLEPGRREKDLVLLQLK